MEQLPNELWGMVLGQLEGVGDFARAQFVSWSFHALVQANCWTKVRKVAIKNIDNEGWVFVKLDTGIPKQRFQLPLHQAAMVLEILVGKATNIIAVHLHFNAIKIDEIQEHIFHCFLDALTTNSQIKVQELDLDVLDLDMFDRAPGFLPRTVQEALRRFLNAKAQSLSSLIVKDWFVGPGPLQPQLLQAFRDCRALVSAGIYELDERLVESILHQKANLKTLKLFPMDCAAAGAVLVDSRSRLRQFWCSGDVLAAYIEKTIREDQALDHPLWSVIKLDIQPPLTIPSFPWGLFPKLKLLIFHMDIYPERFVELVSSFLTYWASSPSPKTLYCRMSEMSIWPNENVAAVQTVCGCQVTFTPMPSGSRRSTFTKQNATLKFI